MCASNLYEDEIKAEEKGVEQKERSVKLIHPGRYFYEVWMTSYFLAFPGRITFQPTIHVKFTHYAPDELL